MFQAVGRELRENKSSEKSTACVSTSIFATFDLLFLHKYTWEGSSYETECVWGTCVDLIPGYLHVSSCWAGVERHKSSENAACVQTSIFTAFDLLFLHKYTWEGDGYETECVWGTCVDLIPEYLYVCSKLAGVERHQSSEMSTACV
jgi:hypothetical protein